jgi:hypothetical protein
VNLAKGEKQMSKNTMDRILSFKPKKAVNRWLFKRSLKLAFTRGFLALSALAAGVGIGFWAYSHNKFQNAHVVAGVIAGLIILLVAIRFLFKFKISVLRSVAIGLLGAAYLGFSLYFILTGGFEI